MFNHNVNKDRLLQSFKNDKLGLLVIFIVGLVNSLMYKMFPNSFLFGLLLITEGALLFLTTIHYKRKILIITISIIFIMLSIFILNKQFDKNIFAISNLESERIRARQEYYASELGKIYRNKIGLFYFNNLRLYFSKISDNFFSHINIQQYFSLNKIIEYEKIPILFAPFFVIGFLNFLINLPMVATVYLFLALIVSSITSFNSEVGPFLLLPFINLCITIGLLKLIQFLKTKTTRLK